MSRLFSAAGNLFAAPFRTLFGSRRPASAAPPLFDGTPVGAADTPTEPIFDGTPPTLGDQRLRGADGQPIQSETPDRAPNLPHVYSFASLYNSAINTYSWRWDEAYRQNRHNALAMRRNIHLLRLLQERQFPTQHMPWHIEPEDQDDPAQMAEADAIKKYIEAIPDFSHYLHSLLEAIWYGRAGVNQVWGQTEVGGANVWSVVAHYPVNGDKIQYTWDGVPQIMVNSVKGLEWQRLYGANVHSTDRSMVLELDAPEWRQQFAIHSHDIVDVDFWDAQEAGGVQGVGIRHWLYWNWWITEEIGTWSLDYLERTGLGISVYLYDAGNPAAKDEAIKYAKDQSRNTWFVWPAPQANGSQTGIQRIETPTAGAEFIFKFKQYHEEKAELFVIGQTMSGGADNESGLGGSGRANFAQQTKYYIIRTDAERLGTTLTRDLVRPMQQFNFPASQFRHKFVFNVERPDTEKQMEAVIKAVAVGVTFKADDVRELTGMAKPDEGDDIIGGQPQQPGGGAPPRAGGALFDGQPPPGGGAAEGGGKPLFDGKPGEATTPAAKAKPAEQDAAKSAGPVQYDAEDKHGDNWKTLPSGTHVLFDGKGHIAKGPAALTGKPLPPKGGESKPPEKPFEHRIPSAEELAKLPPLPGEEDEPKTVEKPPEKPKPAAHKPSNAPVEISTAGVDPKKKKQSEKNTKDIWKEVLGSNNPQQVASLVGAPDDAKIGVQAIAADTLSVMVDHPDYEAHRIIGKDHKGKTYIKNDEFFMKPSAQGKGLGTKIFGDQVEQAKKDGVSYLKCHAAKKNPNDPSKQHNGYYTWPRMGYDMDLEELDSRDEFQIKKQFPKANSIQDVMATKEGRDWWKKNGFDLPEMKFDLTPGSRSMKILEAYQNERAEKGK